jgi:Cof subfamily protein (haloacid dehalogenase superfamily)
VDIRLLVLDIDGTIAGESNQVRTPVLEAIQSVQAQGVQVAIATGRMYGSALRFYHQVGSRLPLMAYHGAWMQDPHTSKRLRHWAVSKTAAEELLDYFEQPELRSRLSVHFYLNDKLYVRELTPETKAYAARSGVDPVVVGDLRRCLTTDPTKVLALSEDTTLIETLLGNLQQKYTPAELYLTRSVATFFEASHPEINKGIAVRYLAEEILGLSPQNVMAIGDNFNDVEMLEYAGVGVAMGNAPNAVKNVANWVAPDVEVDGVASAIAQYIL